MGLGIAGTIGAISGVAGIASTVSGLVGGPTLGGAGATLAGSGISAAAIAQGGEIQAAAAADALAKQEALGPSLTAPYNPFLTQLPATETGLANPTGTGPGGIAGELTTLEATPGYQFTKQQGIEGVTSQASGAGLARSGANEKNVVNYSEGLAANQYQNLVQNFINTGGQQLGAANDYVTAAQGNQNSITNLILEQGQAKASGVVGAGNTIGGGVAASGNQLMPQSNPNPFAAPTSTPQGYTTPPDPYGRYAPQSDPYAPSTNPLLQSYVPPTLGGTPTSSADVNNYLLPPPDFNSG